MVSAESANPNLGIETTNLPRAAWGVLVLGVLISWPLLAMGDKNFPDLHTILDTSVALLAGMLALALWDMGQHIGHPFPKWLATCFAVTFVLTLVHVLVTVEWSGQLSGIAQTRGVLRPATWPPSIHVLSLGFGLSLWRLLRGDAGVLSFSLLMAVLGVGLLALFQLTPTYTAPTLVGVTRPALAAAPLLSGLVAIPAWLMRDRDRLLRPIAWTAAVLCIADLVILYSRAPPDGLAMASHVGRISGFLVLFLSVTQIASRDMLQRIRAEAALAQANADLDRRVLERTTELTAANESLGREMVVRQEAEDKATAQVERLFLLHQITRAIGERQDLNSIFQIVVRSVEAQLPADFACLCLYDDLDRILTVAAVGVESQTLAMGLALPERARVDIDQNGLSRCVRGQLVYEADIAAIDFPFPQRLARGGLGSMVAAPLQIESKVFGVLVVARFRANGFVSGECEFLRQLSEHAALAAHQGQLHGALQDAYDDLRQSQQAILQQERLRALGQMASGIAHDINNALSPVALYTEAMMETETGLSPTGRSQLEVIQRAVEDVTHTIARMKEFYRQRETQLELAPVRLEELVHQVLDLTRARWSDMAVQRGAVIKVQTELRPNAPAILGVESEIREALINLVLNAVDAMPEGGTLALRTRLAGGDANGRGLKTLGIEVADDGVGMDAETHRRCLEPFFTTKGERGTGLGLGMVYGVAQRHGAEMDVRSTPGVGTVVSLAFPVPESPPAASPGGATAAATTARLRLLIVDDDPVLLKALREILEQDGHVVTAANGGRAAIEAFDVGGGRDSYFAAVITDLGMPYVDGRKVAAEIKAMSPTTPVLLLTGWGQGFIAEADMPPHVDQVLSKPPKIREIRAALAQQCMEPSHG
ncbi:response regulator [Phenylobacterium sp. LjRoot225]|uniref:hybrid sensor histidine kinase/response regulator n=1 Tax=Phenylobacterium sp. LjRoot225 TaxID=3342285 RepID=UPI003ECEAD4F